MLQEVYEMRIGALQPLIFFDMTYTSGVKDEFYLTHFSKPIRKRDLHKYGVE